ncbi:hypothetical protein Droror1_Dr00019371 [Drosera rotundifolia]
MDKHVHSFLTKLSILLATISTLLLLVLLSLPPPPCPPSSPFPKSTCDVTHRRFTNASTLARRLHSTAAWIHKLNSFSALFTDLHFLSNDSKVLIMLAGAGHEVMAMNRFGIEDVIGIDVVESEPLVRRGDVMNLPFFDGVFDVVWTSGLEVVLWPVRFVREMERVGGMCVLLVEERGEDGVREVVRLFRRGRLVEARSVVFEGARMTMIVVRVGR